MGFWRKLGTIVLNVGKVGAVAVVDTVTAGKPITLGNIGRDAVKVAVEEQKQK